jgi:acyl-CoA dehydrogenase
MDFQPHRRADARCATRRAASPRNASSPSPPSATASRASRWTCSRKPGSIGLINPTCPAEYGGARHGRVREHASSPRARLRLHRHPDQHAANGLALTPVKLGGTEEQKKKYLGMLTSEPILASYCDERARRRQRRRRPQDALHQHGNDYVLNGQKCWITNAQLRPLVRDLRHQRPVAASTRASPPSSSTATPPACASARRKTSSASARATPRSLHLDDVKVPKANLLAPEGQGFKLAMETFNQTRPDIAAGATGLMRRCLDESVAYAKERKAFGQPIGEHQIVQAMLAEMAIRIEATRLLYQKAAWNLDNGVRDPLIRPVLAKAFGADSAMADRGRRRPGLRRQRLREGVPRREADARRQGAPDLRGHEPDPARSSSPSWPALRCLPGAR